MTDMLWPLATVVVAMLVWDALRRWLSRDDLVNRVVANERRVEACDEAIVRLSDKLGEQSSRLVEVEKVSSATRDKLSADAAARATVQHARPKPWPGFDRPRRDSG